MGKAKKIEKVIYFCNGKKCCKYNKEIKDCLKDLVKDNGLKEKVAIEKMKCQGMCKQAPVLCIYKNECIGKVSVKEAKKLFEKHIVKIFLFLCFIKNLHFPILLIGSISL